MLSPHEKELLTAYVDGELNAGQSRQVERLLRRSGEARALLERLQEDSATLRKLPRISAPVDLSDAVLKAINRKGLKPGVRLRVASPPPVYTIPSWVGFAAAAAVLLLIGLGSFLLHSQDGSHEGGPGPELARGSADSGETPRPTPQPPDRPRTPVVKETPKLSNPPVMPGTPDEREPFREDPDDEPGKPIPGTKVTPEKPKPSVLTSPDSEAIRAFERVEVGLPVVLKLHELDTPEQSVRLRAELGQGRAFRVELLARDANRGFERLRGVLTRQKITLLQDPVAQARLKQPRLRSDYGLFVENITPEQAVRVLRATGVADRNAAAKKAAELRFDGSLVVKPFSRWDRKELWDLLGVDPVRTRPAAPAPKVAVDIHRPLSDDTNEKVKAALEGRGVPRPGAPVAVTAYLTPLRGPLGRSVELRRFLDGRKPEQPGTVQLFIVLRNVGG
jgi:hypothetical protein